MNSKPERSSGRTMFSFWPCVKAETIRTPSNKEFSEDVDVLSSTSSLSIQQSPNISPTSSFTQYDRSAFRFRMVDAVRNVWTHMHYEYLLAGMTAGTISTVTLHPLDLLKIRLAVNDGLVSTRPQYSGLKHAINKIWTEEGVRGFYRGVTPNSLGAGIAWGFFFFFFNTLKQAQFDCKRPDQDLNWHQHILGAAEAGVLSLAITNPIWVVKTRMCLQYSQTSDPFHLPASRRYYNMMDAFNKVYRYEGARAFYKGIVPGLLGVSHGALQFMAYEEMKKYYIKEYELDAKNKLGFFEYIMFASVSKIFAGCFTYPSQVLRARLQDQHSQYKGTVDAIVKIVRLEGIKGFYKGLVPNLLRVTPACCITYLVYENLLFKHKQSNKTE